jgi:hypothetical protein
MLHRPVKVELAIRTESFFAGVRGISGFRSSLAATEKKFATLALVFRVLPGIWNLRTDGVVRESTTFAGTELTGIVLVNFETCSCLVNDENFETMLAMCGFRVTRHTEFSDRIHFELE